MFLSELERDEIRAEIRDCERQQEPPLRPVGDDWMTSWQERAAVLQRHIDRLQTMLAGGVR